MRVCRLFYVFALAVLMLAPTRASAQVQLSPVVSGLSSPVFIGHAGDGLDRLFIVEQTGLIRVLQPGASAVTTFLDLRSKIVSGGERGLLGLAFHPQYASNGRLFVFYTRAGDGALVISEFTASPANANTAGTAERILLTIPHPTNTNHNGGMLAFGPDGLLYVGVGDGGGANDPTSNAQSLDTLLGKILRIDVNGAAPYGIPADNPFSGAIDGRDEIYAYGLRNPWRFSFDRVTGAGWIGDVGQGQREEVNSPIVNGGNYGWRAFEGNLCTGLDSCTSPGGFIFPVFDYTHVNGRCSLTGGYVYRGALGTFDGGTYVYGDFCSGEIFTWNGVSQSVLLDTTMRISSFGEDEHGEIYVADLAGTISRLNGTPAPCTYAVSPTTVKVGAAASSVAIAVSTGAGCAWTATSSVPWASVSPAAGSGPASVTLTISPYTGKPKKRTGTFVVAGQTITVQQSR